MGDGLTTDPNSPCLRKIQPNGQQKCYLVLSDEERAKGFVRPVRYAYLHLKCGVITRMGQALSETYARDPHFYGGTFCCGCGTHFPLRTADGWQFLWEPDGEPVGSNVEEAQEFIDAKQRAEAERHAGESI